MSVSKGKKRKRKVEGSRGIITAQEHSPLSEVQPEDFPHPAIIHLPDPEAWISTHAHIVLKS